MRRLDYPPYLLRVLVGSLSMRISRRDAYSSFGADDLDSPGEIITRARIVRGFTQTELDELLGMTQQQGQRYERDRWQKISLWRLAEAADALGLDLSVRAWLPASSTVRPAGVG